MRNTLPAFRAVGAVLVLVCAALFASLGSAMSAEEVDDKVWQETITGQIEAFRRGDGKSALSFAGFAFQMRYVDRNPQAFVSDIARMGYTPIINSREHSFGAHQWVGNRSVVQEVSLTGPDQGLYKAFYQLSLEADGWRVYAVQLRREPGLAI